MAYHQRDCKALVVLLAACVFMVWFLKTSFISYQEIVPMPMDNSGNGGSYPPINIANPSADWFRYRTDTVFKIIILTQRRHWSLERLLKSIQAASYINHRVSLDIRIDFHTSDDHNKTIQVANNFNFTHGPKNVHVYNKKQGLIYGWFNAWTPASEQERAIILEDDMELSPLWYIWIQRAWHEYGDLTELGGISICRQRMDASDGAIRLVESDSPFLYRLFGSFGFSPNARYWRGFVEWARSIDLKNTDVRVPGTITTKWWEKNVVMWSQYWIWWCSKDQQLYTLYVHSRNGALIAHWQEAGEHSARKKGSPSDKLLYKMEPVLQTFPKVLQHYGWNFRPERYKATTK